MSKEKVFSPKQLHKLESPQRYEALPPNEIWDIIGLHDGDCVGDVGCGIGFFSIPAAQRVGEERHEARSINGYSHFISRVGYIG